MINENKNLKILIRTKVTYSISQLYRLTLYTNYTLFFNCSCSNENNIQNL